MTESQRKIDDSQDGLVFIILVSDGKFDNLMGVRKRTD